MNEVFKPDVVERSRTEPPGAPRPPTAPPTLAKPRPSVRRRMLLVLALAVAGFFALEKFETRAPPTIIETKGERSPPQQTVRAAPIALGDMPITLDALGAVVPFETVTIKTQIPGKLTEVGFAEGQSVRQGDFIAQIDPQPYQAALAAAQAQLAKDEALLAQAENNLARYQALAKQDSIARQQVTDQEALVAQDKAAIAADKAQVETAQINLNYTRIVSPITGRAGLRLVDPGNYLQPSDSAGIVVITQIDPISVVFSTPEDNLPRIAARLKLGAKLPVTVFDRANVNKIATGTLATYDSQIDVATGTIKMRATFDNPDGVLFPQQFVNVRLLVETMTNVVLAPNAAIQVGPSGDFVYALNDDATVSKRDVVTGPGDGARTTITKGLVAGDRVVIDGVDRLRDGAKVRLAEEAAGEGADKPAPGAGAGGQSGRHRRRQDGATAQ